MHLEISQGNQMIWYVRCGFQLVCYSNFVPFWLWKISWPWNLGNESLVVIESGTIRYIGYGFLLVFYSNFVPPYLRYSTLKKPWPWKPGYGLVKVIENVTIR